MLLSAPVMVGKRQDKLHDIGHTCTGQIPVRILGSVTLDLKLPIGPCLQARGSEFNMTAITFGIASAV